MMTSSETSTDAINGSTLTPFHFSSGSLHEKVVVITGASSGIGRAIAQAYAAAGAYVVNADLRADPPPVGHQTAEERSGTVDLTTPTVELINTPNPGDTQGRPRAAFVQCNVTEPVSVEAAVKFAVQLYGRLDVMVNNAGVSAESVSKQRIHEQEASILDRDLAVNVRGVWLGCKYAISQMLDQPVHPSGDRGWIINMASIAGLVGLKGSSAYCASKGAVIQMTKSLAVDYAQDRIHINCINPGFVQTNLLEQILDTEGKVKRSLAKAHPWGRLAQPDDIAKMAVFLAGEGASFVTGAAFTVDGGYTAQ